MSKRLAYIKKNYLELSDEEMAKDLDTTPEYIEAIRKWYELLRKPRHRQVKWTPKEEKILARVYPTSTWEEILKALPNRNVNAIRLYANKNNIFRTEETVTATRISARQKRIRRTRWALEHSQAL